MRRSLRLASLSVAIVAVAAAAVFVVQRSSPSYSQQPKLQQVISDVSKAWPHLEHTAPPQVERLMTEENAILFDTRTPDEYAVSHLPGAIRVDPDMDRATFLKRYGDMVAGKPVVFYCAVGVRSSRMATRVGDGLKARGASAIHGLEGGIFAWHDAAAPLEDTKGPTEFVHTFSDEMSRMLRRPQLARSAPAN